MWKPPTGCKRREQRWIATRVRVISISSGKGNCKEEPKTSDFALYFISSVLYMYILLNLFQRTRALVTWAWHDGAAQLHLRLQRLRLRHPASRSQPPSGRDPRHPIRSGSDRGTPGQCLHRRRHLEPARRPQHPAAEPLRLWLPGVRPQRPHQRVRGPPQAMAPRADHLQDHVPPPGTSHVLLLS